MPYVSDSPQSTDKTYLEHRGGEDSLHLVVVVMVMMTIELQGKTGFMEEVTLGMFKGRGGIRREIESDGHTDGTYHPHPHRTP